MECIILCNTGLSIGQIGDICVYTYSSGRGSCLENKPLARDFEYPVEHAGRDTDGDLQCKLQFGSWSKQCKFTVSTDFYNVSFQQA